MKLKSFTLLEEASLYCFCAAQQRSGQHTAVTETPISIQVHHRHQVESKKQAYSKREEGKQTIGSISGRDELPLSA